MGGSTTTTTRPTPTPFSFPSVLVVCVGTQPSIQITFPNRPELNGLVGVLVYRSFPANVVITARLLLFNSNAVVTVPWPDDVSRITLTYLMVGRDPVTVGPLDILNCSPTTTTTVTPGTQAATTTTTTGGSTSTTTSIAPTTTGTGVTTTTGASTSTTIPPSTSLGTTTSSSTSTSTASSSSSTTTPGLTPLPSTFTFGAAATVCVREVPTIRITFQNQFPQLAGQTGTLTMASVLNGNVASVQSLVYQPGATVDLPVNDAKGVVLDAARHLIAQLPVEGIG